eukprot:4441528-Pyramimonas_sp.AAC.1
MPRLLPHCPIGAPPANALLYLSSPCGRVRPFPSRATSASNEGMPRKAGTLELRSVRSEKQDSPDRRTPGGVGSTALWNDVPRKSLTEP